jgi:acetyl esterase/lipase
MTDPTVVGRHPTVRVSGVAAAGVGSRPAGVGSRAVGVGSPGTVRGVDPREVLSRPASAPDLVVRYANHPNGLIEAYLPPGIGRPLRPAPLVVLVHGGFWGPHYDRTHLRPLAYALANDGLAIASVEYRRIGTGGWPATRQDIKTATGCVAELFDEVAPGHIDRTAPYVLAGHSAGGHLALWAGLLAGPQRVRRVVALAPVSDLARAAEINLADGAVQALLGGAPHEQPHAYADADLLDRLDEPVAVTVIHGSDDLQVPVEMSRHVARTHPHIDYRELPGIEHFALIDPRSPAYPVVLSALRTP